MPDFILFLGNKNYTSWSLRAWLMLQHIGIPFDEQVIPLYQPGSREELLRHTPSGRVPALHHGGAVIWDSLAIGEYLAELFPDAGLWPAQRIARATARSVSAEMHSGFAALRSHLPMNMRSSFPNRGVTPDVQTDINRITALWRDCRRSFGGDGGFLFGSFTIADAMYAPVASRFLTYHVDLDRDARDYVELIWALPALQTWLAAAKNEPMIIDDAEF